MLPNEKIRSWFHFSEWSGAVGDVGILFPIAIALIYSNGLNPVVLFGLVGIVYLFAGSYFKVPIPVQPLKAFATLSIAGGFAPTVIAAGGLIMGMILLRSVLTGITKILADLFPRPIIRGIQFGTGLLLITTALKWITEPLISSYAPFVQRGDFGIFLEIFLFIGGGMILWIFSRNPKVPAALLLLVFGLFGSILFSVYEVQPVRYTWAIMIPSEHDFTLALLLLVIPQIPLTLGNAVVATRDVSHCYFGDRAKRVHETSLATSLGIANLITGFLGGMPVCHGSGGVTAHYSFGARTGGASILMGCFCLLIAFGFLVCPQAVYYLTHIPKTIFGLLLLYIGVKHAALIKDVLSVSLERWVAFGIGVVGCFTANLGIAFLIGTVSWLVLSRYRFSNQLYLNRKSTRY